MFFEDYWRACFEINFSDRQKVFDGVLCNQRSSASLKLWNCALYKFTHFYSPQIVAITTGIIKIRANTL